MSKDGRNNIKLKLIGKNQEDLRVISAYTQDSIVSVRDIVFFIMFGFKLLLTQSKIPPHEYSTSFFEKKNIWVVG